MNINWRNAHRNQTLLAVVPLTLTVATAVLYRVLHSIVGMERSDVRFLISMHQGTWFGVNAVLFTSVNALLALSVTLSASVMLWTTSAAYRRSVSAQALFPWPPRSLRDWHRWQSTLSIGMLSWAAVSGAGYRFLRNAVGLEKERIGWLLEWHHFNFFDGAGSIVWCLLCGVLLSTAITTGIIMHPGLRKLIGR